MNVNQSNINPNSESIATDAEGKLIASNNQLIERFSNLKGRIDMILQKGGDDEDEEEESLLRALSQRIGELIQEARQLNARF